MDSPIGIYRQWTGPLGYLDTPVFATRPLTPENLHPMAHNLAIERKWYEQRMQVKINLLYYEGWITIDKDDYIQIQGEKHDNK